LSGMRGSAAYHGAVTWGVPRRLSAPSGYDASYTAEHAEGRYDPKLMLSMVKCVAPLHPTLTHPLAAQMAHTALPCLPVRS
jgi:hypothetical protein